MVRRCLFVVVIVAVAAAGGCSYVPSFAERGYDDFTTYFNTYYNAQAVFEKGRRGLQGNEGAVDRTAYVSLFPAPEQGSGGKSFKKAIEKSAKILREHPNSRFVNDALLLIGKSYFYQQNYVAAEQKFREVISLGEGGGDEARFWVARTLSASGAYNEGIEHLQATLQREDLAEAWVPRLHLVLGQLYVRQGAWESAIRELEKGLESGADGRSLEARAHFLLGQLYETTGQYDKSVQHYRTAADQRPRYELAYAAQVSAIRVQGVHGDAEKALRRLSEMEGDDKNYENRGELAYLRGRIEQAQGNARRAERLYRDVLYRSDAPISEVKPRIHYALGLLNRDAYGDYVVAAAHFDTASTSLDQTTLGVGERRLPPYAITDLTALSEQFGTFADVRERISRMDSLLYLGSLDRSAFREKILKIQRQKAREMAQKRRRQAERERQQSFGQSGGQREDDRSGATAAQQAGKAGFLFHENPIRVQRAKVEFRRQWGKRPLVENWRRQAALTAVADEEAQAPGGVASDSLRQQGEGRALPSLDLSNVPRDARSQARMKARLAQARYELGNVLFLQMQRPDSAAAWYRKVITKNENQSVADRAYYALAEVQRALGDTAAAQKLYEEGLRRDPDAEMAERLRRRLGRSTNVSESQPDTLALASAAYAESYSAWQQERFSDAIPRFVTVAGQYPNTPVAPKALLAAGQAALQWSRRDSLALTGELPLPLSDSLRRVLNLESAAPPSDTLVAADTLSSAPAADTLAAAAPDSLMTAPADSLTATDTTTARAAPASSPPADDSLTVSIFYETVTERYPQSPQAERAQRVLDAIRERTAPPPDTTTAATPADTTAAATPSDTVATPQRPSEKRPVPRKDVPADTTRPQRRARPAPDETPADTTRPQRKIRQSEREALLQEEARQARSSDSTRRRPQQQTLPRRERRIQRARPDSVQTDTLRARPKKKR